MLEATGGEAGPEGVTHINASAYAAFRRKLGWVFWLLLGGAVVWSIGWAVVLGPFSDFVLVIAALPWLGLLFWYGRIAESVRRRFWKQFAKRHGWTYAARGDTRVERAVMFRQGYSRTIRHVISGNFAGGRPLRIFEYQFSVGYGSRRRDYHYTVFEVRFTGRFPHLYLNYLDNHYGVSVGGTVPLPQEFEQAYRLSAPKEYELEALQIFTPELLAYLLDTKLPHDVELVDHELLIFTWEYVDGLKALEAEFATAVNLMERLARKLDRFTFAEIGTHPTSF